MVGKLVESRSFWWEWHADTSRRRYKQPSGRCDGSAPASRSYREKNRKCWKYGHTCPATNTVAFGGGKMEDIRITY